MAVYTSGNTQYSLAVAENPSAFARRFLPAVVRTVLAAIRLRSMRPFSKAVGCRELRSAQLAARQVSILEVRYACQLACFPECVGVEPRQERPPVRSTS